MIPLESVPAWMIIPFVVMLLSIAILPLVPATAEKWEDWRFQLGIALVLGVPVIAYMAYNFGWVTVGHTAFEYFQFIALLFALFVVSGSIYLEGDIRATPKNNTIFLAIGAAIASFVGTTGAAMLLIRPLLNINAERKRKAQTVIFTILIVANNGGLLTPLGDPPLFLGFLRGVPFTWTFHLIPEWLVINGLLLVLYYALDTAAYAKEEVSDKLLDYTHTTPIRLRGAINFIFFAVIIVGVAVVPSIDLQAIEAGTATWASWVPWRELLFGLAVVGSFVFGSKKIRYELNEFTWGPIVEVAVLFIGIFATMMPALRYLAEIAPKLPLNEVTFYLFTGGLSGFLDNAPTYATFFEMAAQLPGEPSVAGVYEPYLVAISIGAVTLGALTYIGNGPNFMVKSVAESRGVQMPSFGGYIGWTIRYLIPVLAVMVFITIAEGTVTTIIGIALGLAILAYCAYLIYKSHDDAKKVKNLVGSRAGT
ncbi:sodium:proton antiporter [Propionimicrobium lymphophilum]|uniref:sodium:proton antiporter n=1 Tax=Propionimicrobium lymphophilum TaxID=33012 RepID=UPI0028899DD8|nr:sodium:proton antiporter [Propionimicrobium lymphophilum]